jgi:xanthine/uracil/vitamin C permease (AzgA family)
MRNPTMWIGMFLSGILVVILQMYRVKGAIIMGKCWQELKRDLECLSALRAL